MADRKGQGRAEEAARRPTQRPRELAEELVRLLAEPNVDPAQVCGLVTRLEELVDRRFAAEEEDERFEEMILEAPWLTAAIRGFKQQHAELRNALSEISWRARREDGSLAWRRRLRSELSDFLERFVEHEVGEDNLMQEAYRGPSWLLQ